jgi:hypothetical protein
MVHPNSSLLALPPPETTVKECTSIVPIMQQCGGSAAISELQGLNISDLFTDFSSSSCFDTTNITVKKFNSTITTKTLYQCDNQQLSQ